MNEYDSDVKYRVKAKAKFNWKQENTVRLEISVGQSYHEGGRMAAAAQWAMQNFDNVIVALGDTLQRYNLITNGVPDDLAHGLTLEKGDDWLERNERFITGMTVSRWDQILKHPNYPAAKAKTDLLYRDNQEIHQAVDEAIAELANRRHVDHDLIPLFNANSRDYLLEEIAGIAVEQQIFSGITAYPGSLPQIWKAVNHLPDEALPDGLRQVRSVYLKLIRK